MTKKPSKAPKKENRYKVLIENIFFDHWKRGTQSFEFARVEIKSKADELGIDLPDNVGDVLYAIRYRTPLPEAVLATQPDGKEWIIEGAGRSRYRFRLVSATRILPREDLIRTAIPDATPELIRSYALDDEQATTQDIRFVEQKFPGMRCRAIATQFMPDGVVALFELTLKGDQIKVVDERHYQLVPADQIDQAAIRNYHP